MTNYDLFRRAAVEQKQMMFSYKGHQRVVCPRVVGTKNGMQKALTFQFAGSTSSSLPPGGEWRCIFISEAQDIALLDGDWHTGGNHSKPQTCVDEIDIQVFIDPNGTPPYAQVA